jgi:hypothetical protein
VRTSREYSLVLREEHQFDPTHRIEIAQAIGEVPDTRCRSAAEECLETPFSFMDMIRGRDDVLKLMLYVVNLFDNRFVFVIESDDNDDVAFDILQSGVYLNILLHRFADASRT